MTMQPERLQVEFAGSLVQVNLNHPPLNVIDFQLINELLAVFRDLEQRPEISVVAIRGGPRGFSAGVDVAIHTPDKIQATLEKLHALILTMVKSQKITLAEEH